VSAAAREVGIGIIGYGMMGKAHSYGYTLAPRIRQLSCRPRLRLISGRNEAAVRRAAAGYGVERAVTDWREVVTAPEVEIVDICTPPGTHAEIVEAAAHSGKAILCEEPLAADYAAAARAAAAVHGAGVKHAIGFNYRRLPALSLMQRMVQEGRIGAVWLWHATWLSDEFLDPEIPFDWRFRRREGASSIADLGAHLIDLARWMVGDVAAVSAQSATFVAERLSDSGPTTVDVDEASSALLRFASGAMGVFDIARIAPGRPCDFVVELNGSRGTLRFDYARLNELVRGRRRPAGALRDAPDPRRAHRAPGDRGVVADRQGDRLRGELRQSGRRSAGPVAQRRVESGSRRRSCRAGVCEAIERAAAQRRWVDVAEVTGGAAE
jgi:predicted dehydrogenase